MGKDCKCSGDAKSVINLDVRQVENGFVVSKLYDTFRGAMTGRTEFVAKNKIDLANLIVKIYEESEA